MILICGMLHSFIHSFYSFFESYEHLPISSLKSLFKRVNIWLVFLGSSEQLSLFSKYGGPLHFFHNQSCSVIFSGFHVGVPWLVGMCCHGVKWRSTGSLILFLIWLLATWVLAPQASNPKASGSASWNLVLFHAFLSERVYQCFKISIFISLKIVLYLMTDICFQTDFWVIKNLATSYLRKSPWT